MKRTLREHRWAHNFRQRGLAEAIGINICRLSRLEDGSAIAAADEPGSSACPSCASRLRIWQFP